MEINKAEYWGLGIIFAPKNQYNGGAIIINFLCWEISYKWGNNS
jgi:hypothetical protein